MTYKKLNDRSGSERTDMILRISDNANIPTHPDNTDYQEYLAWVAEGNTAEAADQTVYKLTTRT